MVFTYPTLYRADVLKSMTKAVWHYSYFSCVIAQKQLRPIILAAMVVSRLLCLTRHDLSESEPA